MKIDTITETNQKLTTMKNFFAQHFLCPWSGKTPVNTREYITPRIFSYEISLSITILAGSLVFNGGTETPN